MDLGRLNDPSEGRPNARDPVDQRLGHTGAMTTQIRGSLVIAYCGDEEAERRALLDENHDHRYQRKYVNGKRKAEEIAGADERVLGRIPDQVLFRTAEN